MLRFFRNIRQKLLENGNLRKYFWYALGEIALVVIGILIALQINNWNEYQKERVLEERYLERLIIDLENDIDDLANAILSNERRKARAEFLLSVSNNTDLINAENATYFIKSIEYAGYRYQPLISDHTFEEIKSSGKLSIIQNESIRTSLSKYYSGRYNQSQFDFIVQDYQLKYLEYQKGILSPSQQIAMGSFGISESYIETEAKDVLARFINNKEFIDHLPLTIQSKTRASETFIRSKEEAENLFKMVNKELKGMN